jgi:hypothetical protein
MIPFLFLSMQFHFSKSKSIPIQYFVHFQVLFPISIPHQMIKWPPFSAKSISSSSSSSSSNNWPNSSKMCRQQYDGRPNSLQKWPQNHCLHSTIHPNKNHFPLPKSTHECHQLRRHNPPQIHHFSSTFCAFNLCCILLCFIAAFPSLNSASILDPNRCTRNSINLGNIIETLLRDYDIQSDFN